MRRRAVALLAVLALVVLDRATKVFIQGNLPLFDSWTVIPGLFNIVHVENTGMAFSLLTDSRWLLASVSSLVIVFLLVQIWNSPEHTPALVLILGGASGNLYDRLLHGAVTDFLDFYIGDLHWPAFNVADSAITVGAALLLVNLLRCRRPAS